MTLIIFFVPFCQTSVSILMALMLWLCLGLQLCWRYWSWRWCWAWAWWTFPGAPTGRPPTPRPLAPLAASGPPEVMGCESSSSKISETESVTAGLFIDSPNEKRVLNFQPPRVHWPSEAACCRRPALPWVWRLAATSAHRPGPVTASEAACRRLALPWAWGLAATSAHRPGPVVASKAACPQLHGGVFSLSNIWIKLSQPISLCFSFAMNIAQISGVVAVRKHFFTLGSPLWRKKI